MQTNQSEVIKDKNSKLTENSQNASNSQKNFPYSVDQFINPE